MLFAADVLPRQQERSRVNLAVARPVKLMLIYIGDSDMGKTCMMFMYTVQK